jgi:hypothetical protein
MIADQQIEMSFSDKIADLPPAEEVAENSQNNPVLVEVHHRERCLK